MDFQKRNNLYRASQTGNKGRFEKETDRKRDSSNIQRQSQIVFYLFQILLNTCLHNCAVIHYNGVVVVSTNCVYYLVEPKYYEDSQNSREVEVRAFDVGSHLPKFIQTVALKLFKSIIKQLLLKQVWWLYSLKSETKPKASDKAHGQLHCIYRGSPGHSFVQTQRLL